MDESEGVAALAAMDNENITQHFVSGYEVSTTTAAPRSSAGGTEQTRKLLNRRKVAIIYVYNKGFHCLRMQISKSCLTT